MMASDDEIDYTLPSAKAKLKGQMDMKTALKARMTSLKTTR